MSVKAKARAAAARGSAENAIKEARLEEIKLMKSLQRDSAAERRKAKMRMIALLRAEKAEQLALKVFISMFQCFLNFSSNVFRLLA